MHHLFSAAPPSATKTPTFALLAVCQLPLDDEIAHVAAQMTTIRTAVTRPYVSSAPTILRVLTGATDGAEVRADEREQKGQDPYLSIPCVSSCDRCRVATLLPCLRFLHHLSFASYLS